MHPNLQSAIGDLTAADKADHDAIKRFLIALKTHLHKMDEPILFQDGERQATLVGLLAGYASHYQGQGDVFETCMETLVACIEQSQAKHLPLNDTDINALLVFVTKNAVDLIGYRAKVGSNDNLLKLLTQIYQSMPETKLHEQIKLAGISMPVYALVQRFKMMYTLSYAELAQIYKAIDSTRQLPCRTADGIDLATLSYINQLCVEIRDELSTLQSKDEIDSDGELTAKIAVMINLIQRLPNDVIAANFPKGSFNHPLQTETDDSLYASVHAVIQAIESTELEGIDELKRIHASVSEYKRGLQSEAIRKVSYAQADYAPQRDIPLPSEHGIRGRIVKSAINPAQHVLDLGAMQAQMVQVVQQIQSSPVYNRHLDEQSTSDVLSSIPAVKLHRIKDSDWSRQKKLFESDDFHFYTIGDDLNRENDNRPIVIKMLGTSGDCRQQLSDFMDEAMAQDCIIVAFNYKLSHKPKEREFVEQACHLTKHVIQDFANGDTTRVTLHGFSLGAAPAVMAGAALAKKGVEVGVIHDRGFSQLNRIASAGMKPHRLISPLMRKLLKHEHLALNAEKVWKFIAPQNKLQLICERDHMSETNRLPDEQRVMIEVSAFDEDQHMISGYTVEPGSEPHLTRLRCMSTPQGQSAEMALYEFARRRIQVGLEQQVKASHKSPSSRKKGVFVTGAHGDGAGVRRENIENRAAYTQDSQAQAKPKAKSKLTRGN